MAAKKHKYSVQQLLNKNDILSHLFLECIPHDLASEIAQRDGELNEKMVHIEVKIEGRSIDPKKFFDLFSDQYDRMLKATATDIVKEQLSEKFFDLAEKMREMEEVVGSWAEDINWDVENPLIKKTDAEA